MLMPYNPLDKSSKLDDTKDKTKKYPYNKEEVITTKGMSKIILNQQNLQLNFIFFQTLWVTSCLFDDIILKFKPIISISVLIQLVKKEETFFNTGLLMNFL